MFYIKMKDIKKYKNQLKKSIEQNFLQRTEKQLQEEATKQLGLALLGFIYALAGVSTPFVSLPALLIFYIRLDYAIKQDAKEKVANINCLR